MRNGFYREQGLLLSPPLTLKLWSGQNSSVFCSKDAKQNLLQSSFGRLPKKRPTHPHAADCAEAFPALQSHRPEDAVPPNLPPPLCSRLEPPFLLCFPGLRGTLPGVFKSLSPSAALGRPAFRFLLPLALLALTYLLAAASGVPFCLSVWQLKAGRKLIKKK